MKAAKILFGISLLGLLCSCDTIDPSSMEPAGVDFSVYSENPYITENGTVYSYKISNNSYVHYRFSPRGVIFRESRYGKMLFDEVPLRTYYMDSDTSLHYDYKSSSGGYMVNGVYIAGADQQIHVDGHFYINDDGVRCLTLSENPGVIFVAE